MTSVDKRVVSMTFDSSSFQKSMSSTLDLLRKFKDTLSFNKEENSLKALKATGDQFNMKNVGDSADGVSAKFLAMAAVGVTALANLTNRVVDSGIAIAKALTIAPILDGFREYEQNMNSIQTILANTSSKGETVSTVGVALDELNDYADKTIYSFSEMTNAIGKFTASGLGLKDSVAAIKGFSNVAATAGSSAAQLANAQIQLSQAMAAGVVRAMDWMSVTNAGMDTEVFRNSLIETARVHGTNVDLMIKKNGSFKASLQEEWLTADIMAETLQKFTGDLTDEQLKQMGYTNEQIKGIQEMARTAIDSATKVKTFTQLVDTTKEAIGTGWATSFKLVLGDFEDARDLFTSLSQGINAVVGSISDSRNALLEGWADLGGRTDLMESMYNVIIGIAHVLKPIRDAFRDMFPPKTAEDLHRFTATLRSVTTVMRELAVKHGPKLYGFFYGFFAVLRLGWDIVKALAGVFFSLVKAGVAVSDGFFAVMGAGGGIAKTFGDLVKSGEVVTRIFDFIGAGIEKVIPALETFGSAVGTAVDWVVGKFKEIVDQVRVLGPELYSTLGDALGVVGDRLSALFGTLKELVPQLRVDFVGTLKKMGTAIADSVAGVGDLWAQFDILGRSSKILSSALDVVRSVLTGTGDAIGGTASGIKDGVGSAMDSAGDALFKGFDWLLESVKNLGKGIKDLISGSWEAVKNAIEVIFTKENGERAMKGVYLGFGAGILKVLHEMFKNGLPFGKLNELIESLSGVFEGLGDALEAFALRVKSEALLNIGKALALITVSVIALSLVPADKVGIAMGVLTVALIELMGAMRVMSGVGGKSNVNFASMAFSMTLLGAALLMLTAAMVALSFLDPVEMATSLGILAGGLLAFSGSIRLMGESNENILKAGASILLMSLALVPLSFALVKLGSVDLMTLIQGLAAIGIALAGFVVASNTIDEDAVGKLGINFLLFALGLNGVFKAVEAFGNLDFMKMVQGFGGLAVTMLLLVTVMNKLPSDTMMKSGGLLVMAVSLNVVAEAIKTLSELGLLGLGQALLAFVVVIGLLNSVMASTAATGLQGPVALVALAGAVVAISLALKLLSDIPILNLLGGVLGLALAFGVLGIAGLVLAPVAPVLAGLALSILALGAAVLLIGAGVYLFAKALHELSKASGDAIGNVRNLIMTMISMIPILVRTLAGSLVELIQTMLGAAPGFVQQLGQIVLAFIQTLTELVPAVLTLIETLLLGIAEVVVRTAGPVANAAGVLMMSFLNVIRSNFPAIVTAGLDMIKELLKGISENLPEIIPMVVTIIDTFLKGIADNIGVIIDGGFGILMAFLGGIVDNVGEILTVAQTMITELIAGIGGMAQAIISAGTTLLVDFLKGFGATVVELAKTATDVVTKIMEEIPKNTGVIMEAAVDMTTELLSQMTSNTINWLWRAGRIIRKFCSELTNWIHGNAEEIGRVGGELVGAMVAGMITGIGGAIGGVKDGFMRGIRGLVGGAEKELEIKSPSRVFMRMGAFIPAGLALGIEGGMNQPMNAITKTNEAITEAFEAMTASLDFGDISGFEPTISPVLDLTEVRREARNLDALFANAEIGTGGALIAAEGILAMETSTASADDRSDRHPRNEGVTLVQNNYSPKALDADEIYRQTRSQLALAKKELEV